MILPALALQLTLLVAVWLWMGARHRHPSTPGRLTFLALALACMAWVLGDLMTLRGWTHEVPADRVKYAGALALSPLWLGFAAHAARLEIARRVPWFPLILLVPFLCLYALMYSPRFGSLFVTTVHGGEDRYGPLWLPSLLYGQALVVAGAAAFVATAFRWRRPGQAANRIAVGIGGLVPLAGNVAYLMGGQAWPYDPTPILIGVSLLAVRSAVFSGAVLQHLPVSQRELVHQLPIGVVLADGHGAVVDINGPASSALGLPENEALGSSVDTLLERARGIHARVSPLESLGHRIGGLVLVEPADAAPSVEADSVRSEELPTT